MNGPLVRAIREAETQLTAVDLTLQASGASVSRLPQEAQQLLAEISVAIGRLEPARMLVDARSEAAQRLETLRTEATRSMASTRGPLYVQEAGRDVRFEVARLLAMQSYLASTWGLYDTLWEALCRLLLPQHVLADRSRTPTFLGTCINGKKSQSGRLGEMLTHLHGWSIGASYYIRNRFLHDGGSALLSNVFDARDVASEYRIAMVFLDDIRQRCRSGDWGLAEQMTWRSGTWPSTTDLKTILDECHTDADEAFRRMLRWAVGSAQGLAHAVVAAGK